MQKLFLNKSKNSPQSRGQAAENWAAAYLQKQGLRLEERNYRCRGGELDLIMRDKRLLIFVEVRLRGETSWANPLESVDYKKQKRLTLAARHYLQQRANGWDSCRFDVLGLYPHNGDFHPDWLVDAFRLDDTFN
jgi:putative endonuclease